MTDQPTERIDPLAVVRMLALSEPTKLDEAAIRAALGDASAGSLAAIAAAFGVSHATVKHTWRANGMPGDGRKRNFPLAEVLIWYLKRNLANVEARGADENTARKRAAEARAAEADARIKETKAQRVEGGALNFQIAVSVIKGIFRKASDGLIRIPQKLRPMFPARYQTELTAEVERELRNWLATLSETSLAELRALAERTGEDV